MDDRERRFCEEYLVDLDARQAALRAGYPAGTAARAAAWIQPVHPARPALRGEVERLMAERSRRTGVRAERVVQELARVAFAKLSDVVDLETGALRPQIGPDDAAAIARLRRRSGPAGPECEVHMHDKNRALELLGRHLGLFTENLRLQPVLPLIVDDVADAPDARRGEA